MSDALERLRKERSSTNPFESKLDFDRWCDEVKAVLADNPHARSRFANYAATAETMYAFKSDPLDAINNAIGLVNEVAISKRNLSLNAKVIQDAVEVRKDDGVNKVSDKSANKIVDRFWSWLKKFADTTISKVAASMITAWLFYLLGMHFGIFLKSGG